MAYSQFLISLATGNMKTYTFRVTMTPDEDGWLVRCPALEGYGAATWGSNKEEALRFIEEVLEMVVEELLEEGKAVSEVDEHLNVSPPNYLVKVSV